MKRIFILLVEDNDDHAELTIAALKGAGLIAHVVRLDNAESAADFLFLDGNHHGVDSCELPNIILLDVKLPGMDGFSLLRKIKADQRTRRIPVIMLTTSSRDEEIARGYDEGANSYIVKPVHFDAFRDKIRDLELYWGKTCELPDSQESPGSSSEPGTGDKQCPTPKR